MIVCFGENTFAQLGIGDLKRDHPYSHYPFGAPALDHDSVQDVQCGSKFSVVLDTAGTIAVCGTVNGINYPVITPVTISYPLKCLQLSCGRKHILALMEGGHVLSWGVGYFGQLGHGDDSSYDNAKLVQALEPARLGSKVIQVACGGSHSGVVTDSGRVFMWGLNKQGQCGLGSKQPESVTDPRPLDPETMSGVKVTSLVCGRNHSAIISTEGKVYTYGATSFGRLGTDRDGVTGSTGAKKTQSSPLEVRYFRNLPVHSLASGDFHMLALAHDCSVHSWGCGADGQLGHVGSLDNFFTPRKISFFGAGSNVVQIVCGSGWSTAVTATGSCYVWGQGDGGWLGVPPPSDLPVLGEGEPPLVPSSSSSSSSSSPVKGIGGVGRGDRAEQVPLKHSCSFDSKHNVLVPVRINPYLQSSQYGVERVRCGGSHTVMFLTKRTDEDKEGEEELNPPLKGSSNSNSNSNNSSSDKRGGAKEGGGLVDSLVGSKRSPPVSKGSKSDEISNEHQASSKS